MILDQHSSYIGAVSDKLKCMCIDFNLTQLISKPTIIKVKITPIMFLQMKLVFAFVRDRCPIVCIRDTKLQKMNPRLNKNINVLKCSPQVCTQLVMHLFRVSCIQGPELS